MKQPPIYVVDASVALSALLQDSPFQTNVALLFTRAENFMCQLLVPSIFEYEIHNRLNRSHNYSHEEIRQYLGLFVDIKPNFAISKRTYTMMQQFKKASVYDVTYHATAIEFNATFITCDKKYYTQTKTIGHIQFISDYT